MMADDSEWDDLSGDGGVLKKITTAPAGNMFLPTHERTWPYQTNVHACAFSEDTESPSHGFKVRAHYTGTLESDGSKCGSSRDKNKELSFTLVSSRYDMQFMYPTSSFFFGFWIPWLSSYLFHVCPVLFFRAKAKL